MSEPTNGESFIIVLQKIDDIKADMKADMDEVKIAIKGVDARLSALELNDAQARTRFEERLNTACIKLGEHDGIAAESRADRKDIRERLDTSNHRLSKLEWSTNLLWVAAGLIFCTVISAIVGGLVAKLLGWF